MILTTRRNVKQFSGTLVSILTCIGFYILIKHGNPEYKKDTAPAFYSFLNNSGDANS